MKKKILITGGAGFIGSHLADELLLNGYDVRILDNLSEQVHGPEKKRPEYLDPNAELIIGDVRNEKDVRTAMKGVDVVYHLAAKVGVGQSMYQIHDYTDVNNLGTATLLQVMLDFPIERLIVASSMSIYGEGLYQDIHNNVVPGYERGIDQLKKGEWELKDSQGNNLKPIATHENKTPVLSSVYALSKYDQERLCMISGRAYNIPTVALRFFNVYGTRQALSNPYTGVLAIFASRYLNDNPPLIYEDGNQLRDFISVKDVASACRLALEIPGAKDNIFNIGSGNSYSINELAKRLSTVMGKEHLPPQITGKYRQGDIRHCFADIERAKNILRFEPQIKIEDGLKELAQWLEYQIAVDKVDEASKELASRGLAV